MNGLISFFIGTVVDFSRERFEVLRNSALRVVSACLLEGILSLLPGHAGGRTRF
jgi:hypothetical protein